MDISYLKRVCQSAILEAAETFKIHIENPIFPLDENIIDIELKELSLSIRSKVYGKMMKNYNLTDKQFEYVQNYTKMKVNRVEERGRAFVKNQPSYQTTPLVI